MSQNKILSMLGLAAKAGKVVSGEFSVEKQVKKGAASLVIVAENASANTKKMFTNMCLYYHIPLVVYSEKAVLGHAIGKELRASLAITDVGFGKQLVKLMDEYRINGGSMNGENQNT